MPKALSPIAHTFASSDFAVVAALLDYYGLPYSVRSLNDYLHHHNFGSLMTEMADCLLQHGVDTTLVNAHPELFSPDVWKALYLQDFPNTNPDKLPTINEAERVIKKGVYLRRALPSLELIDVEVSAERPVIIAYNAGLIDPLRGNVISHAILTMGDGEQYTLFEPSYENLITLQPKQTVLYAITQVRSPDPTAGSLILCKEHLPAPTAPPEPLPEI